MRKTLILTALFILGLAAPVAAVSTSWPTGCEPNPKDDKQAAKMFDKWGYTGDKEVECGTVYGTNGQDKWRDSNFGNTSGSGAVEGFNDEMDSFVLFNRSTFGVCFVFYIHADYGDSSLPSVLAYWVPGKWGIVKYVSLRVFDLPWYWDQNRSSAKVLPKGSIGSTGCHELNTAASLGHVHPPTPTIVHHL